MSDGKPFVHPQALCESLSVGNGTTISAFAHVLPKAILGKDCTLGDYVFVENDVTVGDRVTIKSGAQLLDGVHLEDDVFVGPNATFTNNTFPRGKHYGTDSRKTVIRQGASIGANATVLPGLTIGARALVEDGAVVTRNVPPNAIVVGNPARIIGYVDSKRVSTTLEGVAEKTERHQTGTVNGVVLHRLPEFSDMRGALTVIEHEKSLPFAPQRTFLVYAVPSGDVRGEHAHIQCKQFLICVKGSCSVVADDGRNRDEWLLNAPGLGLYLPPMTWGTQYRYSSDAVLLVFASHPYSADDYIRDYDVFLNLAKVRK